MEPPWKAYNVLRKMDYPYEASIMSSCDNISRFLLAIQDLGSHAVFYLNLLTNRKLHPVTLKYIFP